MILKDAIKLIQKQMKMKTNACYNKDAWHYGKMELIELLSKIYNIPEKDIIIKNWGIK